jgi:GntR family transcriptional regulator
MAALRFGPISPAASGPLYEQIVLAVKREVAAGRLIPGDALPSVRALAAELLVSLITVKRAYEELERDGILFSRQGLGTFIADAGAEQARRDKRDTARQALRQAVAAGRQGGLSDKDLLDWLKKEL